ncbi:MAG: DUF2927 domain-containing protein [Thiotrichales bacterium]|nr:DUF2927 domain-containing protein [Thiotrichales bacterium]
MGCSTDFVRYDVDRTYDVELLLDYFEQVSFVDEYDEKRFHGNIRKWEAPLKIRLFGDQAPVYSLHTRTVAEKLSILTGIPMEVVDAADKINFEIHFVPWDDIPELARPYSPNPEWLDIIIEDSSCLFIYKHDAKYEIKYAYVYVSTDEAGEDIRSCILEEMTQALGFPNDSDLIKPSVFNQWDHLHALTVTDEILVRTLYDPRLTPGMPRDTALRQARIIMNELLEHR